MKEMNQPIKLGTYKEYIKQNEVNIRDFELEKFAETDADRALSGSPDMWYTVKNFAEKAGVPTNTVYQWVNRGKVRSDTNSHGVMMVYPPDLANVPRPVAFDHEDRQVWTGTFSESGRKLLEKNSLGGNESFTLEMGARFLMVLFGKATMMEADHAVSELLDYCNQHPRLGKIFKKNIKVIADSLE